MSAALVLRARVPVTADERDAAGLIGGARMVRVLDADGVDAGEVARWLAERADRWQVVQ